MPTSDSPSKLLSLSAASRVLGLSTPTLRKHIQSGVIPAHKLGDRLWINIDEAMAATQLNQANLVPQSASVEERRRQIHSRALQKLEEALGGPDCGICHERIVTGASGLMLSEVDDERDKKI